MYLYIKYEKDTYKMKSKYILLRNCEFCNCFAFSLRFLLMKMPYIGSNILNRQAFTPISVEMIIVKLNIGSYVGVGLRAI